MGANSEQIAKDNDLLMRLGYKPELKRSFSPFQVFGVAFSIMSLVPSIASVMSYSLNFGGIGMVWGWFIPCIFIMSVGMAMSEFGSAEPTSGGLYFTAFRYTPPKLRRPVSFLCGYANTLGLVGGICSIGYGLAGLVLSIPSVATMNENGEPGYVPTKFEEYGVFVGFLLTVCVVCLLTDDLMAQLQTFAIFLNVFLVFLVCIAVPIGASNSGILRSGKFIFTSKANISGWQDGWAFLLCFQSAVWTIGAFDSSIHVGGDSAHNAQVAVPFGILTSIGACWVLGFAVLCCMATAMPDDFTSILNSAIGQPFAQIIYNALGKKWTIAIVALMSAAQWLMLVSIMVATSRQTWAFARDGALPFSRFVRRVHKATGIPRYAVLFSAAIAAAITCLVMIDEAAADAVFSLAASSNSLAWLIPIAALAFGKREGFVPGPFYLGGILSRVNGIIASMWLCFIAFALTMIPTSMPVTADTANYTPLINGVVWFGALAYYAIDARKWYTGPKHTIEEEVEGLEPLDVGLTGWISPRNLARSSDEPKSEKLAS